MEQPRFAPPNRTRGHLPVPTASPTLSLRFLPPESLHPQPLSSSAPSLQVTPTAISPLRPLPGRFWRPRPRGGSHSRLESEEIGKGEVQVLVIINKDGGLTLRLSLTSWDRGGLLASCCSFSTLRIPCVKASFPSAPGCRDNWPAASRARCRGLGWGLKTSRIQARSASLSWGETWSPDSLCQGLLLITHLRWRGNRMSRAQPAWYPISHCCQVQQRL